MLKKIITIMLISVLSFASMKTIDKKTITLGVGVVEKYKGNHKTANDIEVSTKKLKLLDLSTKFDCKTGRINVDAIMANLPKELNEYFDSLGKNMKKLLKELAYQEATEYILDQLAKIHYNMTKKASKKALTPFLSISSKATYQCLKSTIGKSFESSLEAGAGFNIYDLFSGKFGINVAELISAIKCFKDSELQNMSDEEKEQFEKSRKYVRWLFYKILNNSLDISFYSRPAECKEFDKQKSKEDEIRYNLACHGTMTDLTGDKIKFDVSGHNVAVGKKETSFSTKKYKKVELSKMNNKVDTQKEGLKTGNIEYEGVLSIKPFFEKNTETIDVLSFNKQELIDFYTYLYEKSKKLLESRKDISKKRNLIITINILKKIFGINTIDIPKLKEFECINHLSYCTEKNFPLYKDKNKVEIQKLVKEEYYNELKSLAYKYNKLRLGLLDEEDINNIKLQLLQVYGKIPENLLKIKINEYLKNQLELFDIYKTFIAAGSDFIFIDRNIYYNNQPLKILEYIDKNYKKINNSLILLRPIDELNMLRILYLLSHDKVFLKMFISYDTEHGRSYIIKKLSDIDTNFYYLDKNKNYIIPKGKFYYYNLSMKDITEIQNYIKLIKDLYITEYSTILLNRLNSVKSWIYSFYKNGINVNKGIKLYQKEEVMKIILKFKQRQKFILLFKN